MVSCSVVALDWVDLTNVASGIFISSVTGFSTTSYCTERLIFIPLLLAISVLLKADMYVFCLLHQTDHGD